jgi:arabinan endo-1,5-alpha-L-arabinosidase
MSSTGGAGGAGGAGGEGGSAVTATYTNPLPVSIPTGGMVENCPDPSVIRGEKGGGDAWYVYCTADPLNDQDTNPMGELNSHLIPVLKSTDLIQWSYVGDALAGLPSWAADNADLWAPEIQFHKGQYYLYYTVTETQAGGSAIAVAVSDSPEGPFVDSGSPVVEPHAAPCCAGSKRWTFDPHVINADDGERYLYYGSYFGGISVRVLSDDGLTSDPASQVEITIPNRYEAAYVLKRGEYYYLLASASDCCNGPLSGYTVFAGRSKSPTGPFVDKEGVPLSTARVGGTQVLAMNGNRWVGPGHNTVLTDFSGQDWILYHAIDKDNPYFAVANGVGPTKRHLMMDALDWIDGWPTARGGHFVSDTLQPAPAAQPGQKTMYTPEPPEKAPVAAPNPALSDEFDAGILGGQWTWVRPPAANDFGLESGLLRFDTQAADLFEDIDNASVLTEAAPAGNYMIETKVRVDLPAEGCCWNFTQGGLIIYKDDDNFIKLVSASIWDTRQIEFAKEVGPAQAGYPRYGSTVVGSADMWTYLRIVKRTQGTEELYTAYSSRDGQAWARGGTWTHTLGAGAKLGLVAMARDPQAAAFPAKFEYVHVFDLQN